ncbi:Uncharacterised protein [Mycobacteroides abscessus subsp. abscessus]|nr:Uncharacterised protein [Mycobacteroides abscessus subsp. abscessus]
MHVELTPQELLVAQLHNLFAKLFDKLVVDPDDVGGGIAVQHRQAPQPGPPRRRYDTGLSCSGCSTFSLLL